MTVSSDYSLRPPPRTEEILQPSLVDQRRERFFGGKAPGKNKKRPPGRARPGTGSADTSAVAPPGAKPGDASAATDEPGDDIEHVDYYR